MKEKRKKLCIPVASLMRADKTARLIIEKNSSLELQIH